MTTPFAPRFTLTPLIQRQLMAIERTVGFLEAVRLQGDWLHALRDEVRVGDALSSVQIEGASLTRERAFTLVSNPPDTGLSSSDREFLNYLAAFEAIDSLRGCKQAVLDRRDLHNLHAIIVRGVRGGYTNAGRFREEPVVIGDKVEGEVVVHHDPPSHQEVGDHVDELMGWLERVKQHPRRAQVERGMEDPWVHPVLAAGIAQHRMVWIHPFLDGNGRTARMFTAMVLYQRGYDFKYLFDLSSYYNHNRDKYYEALRTADQTGDYTRWLEYFVGGFSMQMFQIREKARKLAAHEVAGESEGGGECEERQG